MLRLMMRHHMQLDQLAFCWDLVQNHVRRPDSANIPELQMDICLGAVLDTPMHILRLRLTHDVTQIVNEPRKHILQKTHMQLSNINTLAVTSTCLLPARGP